MHREKNLFGHVVDFNNLCRAFRGASQSYLEDRLHLQLDPRRVVIAPISCPRDFLGYVRHPDGRVRIRRRSVGRLWRRLPVLQARLDRGQVSVEFVNASLASWFGLAKHADAFRLSRAIFGRRDVRNTGKRLLVRSLLASQ